MQRIISLWKSSVGGKLVVILGSVVTLCLSCGVLTLFFPSSPEQSDPGVVQTSAAQTIQASAFLIATETSTATLQPILTNTAASTDIPQADYPRVVQVRFEELQKNFAAFVELHQQFAANLALSQDANWYTHTITMMSQLTDGATEIAGMQNYPPEYAAFHQEMQLVAEEGKLLFANYMTALDNQDAGALNQATANLSNMIPHFNQASAEMTRLNPTATPRATSTFLPTVTVIVSFPTSPPQQGVCSCAGNLYNCSKSDFSSKSAAQACYDYCISIGAGDVHDLDRNHDGGACDSGLN